MSPQLLGFEWQFLGWNSTNFKRWDDFFPNKPPMLQEGVRLYDEFYGENKATFKSFLNSNPLSNI